VNQSNQYFAIVLAADRNLNDPVAHAAKVACKALALVQGTPMIQRVLVALNNSPSINNIIVCANAALLHSKDYKFKDMVTTWVENKQTPSSSTRYAMNHVPTTSPAIVTTSDVPFLSTKIIEHFCSAAKNSNTDLAVGFVDYKIVKQYFPTLPKTTFKCKDGEFCGCNLFAFNSTRSRAILDVWKNIEHQRKHPLKLIRILGWRIMLRYILKLSTLAELLDAISAKAGVTIVPVLVPFPEAAVDVDSAVDWEFVQSIMLEKI
jgi:GTP:adenosylcobinamide-phosphate guanylyltransferase